MPIMWRTRDSKQWLPDPMWVLSLMASCAHRLETTPTPTGIYLHLGLIDIDMASGCRSTVRDPCRYGREVVDSRWNYPDHMQHDLGTHASYMCSYVPTYVRRYITIHDYPFEGKWWAPVYYVDAKWRVDSRDLSDIKLFVALIQWTVQPWITPQTIVYPNARLPASWKRGAIRSARYVHRGAECSE